MLASTHIRLVLGAALVSSLAGCTTPEPSPRSVSFWRAYVVAEPVSPAIAVMQGEGGPVEITVRNAGVVPVRAFEVVPDASVDDGALVEADGKGAWPELAPGESAKATVIVRPSATGDAVVHRFRVTYADARKDKLVKAHLGDGAATKPDEPARSKTPLLRKSGFDVTMHVSPASVSIEDARSKATVESGADAVYSATLGAWAFEREDGVVMVPEGAPVPWPGVSLRAVAWVDLLVGDKIPLRFGSDEVHERMPLDLQVEDSMDPAHRGEASIAEDRIALLFAFCAENKLKVETVQDGARRILLVK